MVDLNPLISIIPLNINNMNNVIKRFSIKYKRKVLPYAKYKKSTFSTKTQVG